ncbi:MAG: signal peptidase I [Erysipelotrichaceae bacterium]|nr:signal peptidase I [Erysipelotrichaceae bacterium]MBR3693338.1 signal peptidase I [Erysipelotrichales bacterium]
MEEREVEITEVEVEEVKEKTSDLSKETKKKKYKDTNIVIDVLSLMRDICVCFLISYVVATFIFKPIKVDGSSMYPTIHHGDIGFSNIFSYSVGGVERFDIVVLYEESLNEYVIKRVIGLPNETIEYLDNQLYVDGVVVSEDFLDKDYCNEMSMLMNDNFTDNYGPVTLQENEYFVVGDNRPKSSDSRIFGPVTLEQIESKGTFVVYPFYNFGIK